MPREVSTRTAERLHCYLDGIRFPCSTVDVLRCLEENDAPDSMLDAVDRLPPGEFRSTADIVERLSAGAQSGSRGHSTLNTQLSTRSATSA